MKKGMVYSMALPSAAALAFSAVALAQAPAGGAAAPPAPCQNCPHMTQGSMGMRMDRGMAMNDMGMSMGRGAHYMVMGALQNPAARNSMTAFVLPDMKSELGLSDAQVNQLDQLKGQLINNEQNTSRQIAAKRQELNNLFTSGTPDQQQVQKDVNEIAQLQAQRLLSSYEISAKMKDALTPEQRSRLEAMQPAQLLNTMTAHMTVDQMSQMMRYMHGAAAAGMIGGAAPGPMMSHGMMSPQGETRSRAVPENSGQTQQQPSPPPQPPQPPQR